MNYKQPGKEFVAGIFMSAIMIFAISRPWIFELHENWAVQHVVLYRSLIFCLMCFGFVLIGGSERWMAGLPLGASCILAINQTTDVNFIVPDSKVWLFAEVPYLLVGIISAWWMWRSCGQNQA